MKGRRKEGREGGREGERERERDAMCFGDAMLL